MAIELKQSVKQTQTLLMSVQVQQAIKILTLGRQELEDYISNELRENPCLEEGEGPAESDVPLESFESGVREDSAALSQIESEIARSTDTEGDTRGLDDLLVRFEDTQSSPSQSERSEDFDVPIYERVRSADTNLHEELEEQIRMMHLTDYEVGCCMELLQYLDDNGFLTSSLEDISASLGITFDDLEYALSMIQKCEPTGVGAANTQECLLLQLRNQTSPPRLAKRILEECWSEFERQDLNKIARTLKAAPEDVKKAACFIRENLDPRPARQFGSSTNQIIIPDVFVFKRADEWIVSLNEEGLPRLRVSQKYAEMVAGFAGHRIKKTEIDAGKLKEFVNEKVKSAKWIVRAISERNKTILRVTEVILDKQKEFFEHGLEHLKPMTLRIIADELGLHESTISRTTMSKYMHTPRGIFELKYFFNSGMSDSDGHELANEAIKNWVSEYIKAEDTAKPLSDQELSDLIEREKGVKVARRTVTKYRESFGLLSSSKRNKRF